MQNNYKEIARLKRKEFSNRSIASTIGIARNTVNSIVRQMIESSYSFGDIESMSDSKLSELFHSNTRGRDMEYVLPNYKQLERELAKPGVTLQLLWEEYSDTCRLSQKNPYQLTQFKKHFKDYLNTSGFTDVIHHKAGEKIEVDWAGSRPQWKDPDTKETIYGWLFVGVLPFSQYGYAEVTADMKLSSWIEAHIHMFEYFGGVSTLLIPDNLKTGVTKHTKNEVVLNPTYSDMADYYGMVILPARVRAPKDKPSAEGLVNILTTRIIAKMRNYQFFTMEEYNIQLRIELDKMNKKPFQKKEGSRYTRFHEIEKNHLQKLPSNPYEMCEWKIAKVQKNAHIYFDKCYYSVPYQYIGKNVKLKIFINKLIIYFDVTLLCEHTRIIGRIGDYSSETEHMPPNSNLHSEWNSTRYLNWAKQKGLFIHRVVLKRFESSTLEQQQYKTVHSILKLADKYTNKRLNDACQLALELFHTPSYRNIKTILDNKQDLKTKTDTKEESNKSRFLRGANYYE